MTKYQQIYRIVRKHSNREDARYAAVRLVELGAAWAEKVRNEAPSAA